MNIKAVIAAGALSVSFMAGQSQAADIDAAAKDVCGCLTRPYAEAQRFMTMAMQAQATGDMTPLMAAQDEMVEMAKEAEVCYQGLVKKYPDIASSEPLQKQVMAVTDTLCPNPLKAMMQMFGVQ